jgi:hypothetical protein
MTERKSRYDLDYMTKKDYVPLASYEYDQINGALKRLDAIASDMELRWGKGKLETLVSPSTGAKFEAARAKLDVAIHDQNVQLVIKRAETMERGWRALQNEAQSLGHKPTPSEIWHANAPAEQGLKEFNIVICKDNIDATLAETDLPVYTVTEIARIVRSWRQSFDAQEAKKLFPGAEIIRLEGDDMFDDSVPF